MLPSLLLGLAEVEEVGWVLEAILPLPLYVIIMGTRCSSLVALFYLLL